MKARTRSTEYAELFTRYLSSEEKVLIITLENPVTVSHILRNFPENQYYIIDKKFYCQMFTTKENVRNLYINNDDEIISLLNQELKSMHFDKVIMNPPFSVGGKIWDIARAHADKVVCLMPLNQYNKKNAQYIETLEFVDEGLFEEADITPNLCITTSTKEPTEKTFEDYTKLSWNQNFKLFYDWNIQNNKGLVFKHPADSTKYHFSSSDFIEHDRSNALNKGGLHGRGGRGWKWNINHDYNSKTIWEKSASIVSFSTEKARDNFARYWYWGFINNTPHKSLNALAIYGLNQIHIRQTTSVTIPQIDWEKISDHPLWNENPDSAVLDVMGLKWNDNKDGVVEK